MIWLKGCPRCDSGDLSEGKDLYGQYVSCLQCGYYLNEAEEVVLRYGSKIKAPLAVHTTQAVRELARSN